MQFSLPLRSHVPHQHSRMHALTLCPQHKFSHLHSVSISLPGYPASIHLPEISHKLARPSTSDLKYYLLLQHQGLHK